MKLKNHHRKIYLFLEGAFFQKKIELVCESVLKKHI